MSAALLQEVLEPEARGPVHRELVDPVALVGDEPGAAGLSDQKVTTLLLVFPSRAGRLASWHARLSYPRCARRHAPLTAWRGPALRHSFQRVLRLATPFAQDTLHP